MLFGLLWLLFFEKKEQVDAHVSTVADYTIEVSNLPKNEKLDENKLKAHLATATGHNIVDIFVAYISRNHIQMLQYRGTLVKRQAHVVKEYRHHCSHSISSDITMTYLNIVQDKLYTLDTQIKNIDNSIGSNRYEDNMVSI